MREWRRGGLCLALRLEPCTDSIRAMSWGFSGHGAGMVLCVAALVAAPHIARAEGGHDSAAAALREAERLYLDADFPAARSAFEGLLAREDLDPEAACEALSLIHI